MVTKVKNDKVMVVESALTADEIFPRPSDRPGVAVFLDSGSVEMTLEGKVQAKSVMRGDAVFQSSGAGSIKNVGISVVRVVWTEYLGKGGSEIWGEKGLAPSYKLLFENQYGRVYDIRIKAEKSEPLHSHHDRIIICLSGAKTKHEMPDGREETSSINAGEIAWRRGGTHIGHNLGKTNLWIIAIEPK